MYGLVPLYDFFNHEQQGTTAFYAPESGVLEMQTCSVIKAGEQVGMSYGDRCNRLLFVYSGFIDPANTNNCIPVPVCCLIY